MVDSPFRGTITVEHAGKPFKMRVDLVGLSDNAKLVLGRHSPQLLTPDFYSKSEQERLISLLPRTMLKRNYAPNERMEYYGVIIPPEISHSDRVFDLSPYGSPRNQETWIAWINGVSQAIVSALCARRKRVEDVLRDVDARLDAFLRRLAAKDPAEVLVFEDDGWRLKPSVRAAFAEPENSGLMRRLRDRALEQGLDVPSYLRQWPSTKAFALKADERLASRAALVP